MKQLIILFLFIGNFIGGDSCLASRRSFGYEVTPHHNVVVGPVNPVSGAQAPFIVAPNQASVDYNYAKALAVVQGGGVAPLLPLIQFPSIIGISIKAGGGPAAWQDMQLNMINMAGGVNNNPTIPELCQMVIERNQRGIVVDFQQGLPAIVVAAAGGPVPPGMQSSLIRGGYYMPVAIALHRFLQLPAMPDFVNLAGGGIATEVAIHFHSQKRISKNVKDITFNSFLLPVPNIKAMINNQFLPPIIPLPQSTTVVTYDYAQTN